MSSTTTSDQPRPRRLRLPTLLTPGRRPQAPRPGREARRPERRDRPVVLAARAEQEFLRDARRRGVEAA
ncbi:hypothetical protein, partial [Streptomyces sp. UH6]|uniref:hypothetical protein n=1 Tax=Streptomyces sp. UH6 TaxID=2748379 RepID=UPI001C5506A3